MSSHLTCITETCRDEEAMSVVTVHLNQRHPPLQRLQLLHSTRHATQHADASGILLLPRTVLTRDGTRVGGCRAVPMSVHPDGEAPFSIFAWTQDRGKAWHRANMTRPGENLVGPTVVRRHNNPLRS